MQWAEYKNTILAQLDSRAFWQSELENMEIRGSEAKASCPFAAERHEGGHDNNPSFSVNFDKGTYYCPVCLSKGNVHTYMKDKYKLTSDKAWFRLGDAMEIERPEGSEPLRPDIDQGLPGKLHRDLMNSTGPIRRVLREKRGFSDKSLVDMQIGWDGERITIPIYDEYNQVVNIRRYKWDAPEGVMKMLNYKDEFGNSYGELRIYGLDVLLDDNIPDIIWCEGETDRIVSQQHGFPAACPTSGAGSWKSEWLEYFRNKRTVYIVQDNDHTGEIAAKKIYDRLKTVVDARIIVWPEGFRKKGDITDFFVEEKRTTEEFMELLKNAKSGDAVIADLQDSEDEDVLEVHLADSSNASLYNKRVKIPVLLSGKNTAPYVIPKTIDFNCECDLDNKKCQVCNLSKYIGSYSYTIPPTDKVIIKLVNSNEKALKDNIMASVGANKNCRVLNMEYVDMMNVEEVRLVPKADTDRSGEKEYVVRMGYIVSHNIKTNKRYTLYGSMHSDPDTQQVSYLFDKAIPEKDLASDFELTEDSKKLLDLFMTKGKSVEEKMHEIHADLERNVTKIWQRMDVAFAVDLVFNSVLSYYFQGDKVERGWTELLIVGDSGQGKSTLVKRLMQHYRLGEMVSGESSSRTGLVYNLQQTQKRWMLQWGALPLNDGGLLAIDELSGVSEEDLSQLSDVRTSGVARVNGVITAETTSRTRVIFIGNPRNGKQLNSETYGVMAALKLMGKTEDVRRLDMAMSVASGDIESRLLNIDIRELPEIPNIYTSDACNMRTLWAWSRQPEDIVITPEAEKEILRYASIMGEMYSSRVPIVEASDQKNKLARLSIACAATLASTDETYTKVIVTKEHVDFVYKFLTRVFASKSLGYDKFSAQERSNTDASEETIAKLRRGFALLPVSNPNELADILYQLPYMDRYTLADYTGLERTDLQAVLKFLTINHIVERFKSEYRRLPLGTALLDNIIAKPITKSEKNAIIAEAYGDDEY